MNQLTSQTNMCQIITIKWIRDNFGIDCPEMGLNKIKMISDNFIMVIDKGILHIINPLSKKIIKQVKVGRIRILDVEEYFDKIYLDVHIGKGKMYQKKMVLNFLEPGYSFLPDRKGVEVKNDLMILKDDRITYQNQLSGRDLVKFDRRGKRYKLGKYFYHYQENKLSVFSFVDGKWIIEQAIIEVDYPPRTNFPFIISPDQLHLYCLGPVGPDGPDGEAVIVNLKTKLTINCRSARQRGFTKGGCYFLDSGNQIISLHSDYYQISTLKSSYNVRGIVSDYCIKCNTLKRRCLSIIRDHAAVDAN